MRKPTLREMASEHRAKQRANALERRRMGRLIDDYNTGTAGSVMGRVLLPGEHVALSHDDDVGSKAHDPANGAWEW